MEGLYPIIRRARRPLVISDDDAGPPAAPAPAVPLVKAGQPVSYAKAAPSPRKGSGIADKRGRCG